MARAAFQTDSLQEKLPFGDWDDMVWSICIEKKKMVLGF
jgi:hypothetical protein